MGGREKNSLTHPSPPLPRAFATTPLPTQGLLPLTYTHTTHNHAQKCLRAHALPQMHISLVKVRFARSLQNVWEAYKAVRAMDNHIFPESKFYDRSIGLVGLWFGGHFRELESPKVWNMKEIFAFGGRKHAKSTHLIKRFPARIGP